MADFICPICQGVTWVIDDNGETVACSCRANRVRSAKTRGLITGIPKKFSGVGLSDDGREITSSGRALNFPAEVTRAVLKYTRTIDEQIATGKGLWFEGDVGTGKTT